MTDLTELRRLAEAATPGPWTLSDDRAIVYGADEAAVFASYIDHGDDPDTPYIAAADPQTVLGLLDTLDRYRAALEKLYAATEPYQEEAAPGEALNGYWSEVFSRLGYARADARDALEAK